MAYRDPLTAKSVYLSRLLRHEPQLAALDMDRHGWVSVRQLLANVNAAGRHSLTREELETIVATDQKGRYRFSPDGQSIKACQGHSIPWMEPELTYPPPPPWLYHGTTAQALEAIKQSGAIRKMKRHAVHMQAGEAAAWQSARRWHRQTPVVLQIDSRRLQESGYPPGLTDNQVWCAEEVPFSCVSAVLFFPSPNENESTPERT